jgi:hypothetical protein
LRNAAVRSRDPLRKPRKSRKSRRGIAPVSTWHGE